MKNFNKILLAILLVTAIVFVFIFLNTLKLIGDNWEKNTANISNQTKKVSKFEKPGVFWGAYTGNTASSFTKFQKQVGRQADIHAVFMGWYDEFPLSLANKLDSNEQILLIYWEQYGVTLDEIINGESDDYIRQFATSAKKYGGPVILVPLHEMNGDWIPWGGTVDGNTPKKVIDAWRHIHGFFNGVTNIKWGWAVNNISLPNIASNSIEVYYPGDEFVDYVGVDGFNFGKPWGWKTYNQLFSTSLTKLSKYNKPIYIFAMASADGPLKAAWITDAFSKIYSNPKIKGWIWFNENKERDWRINSDPESLNNFKSSLK